MKAVRVRTTKQTYDSSIKKHFHRVQLHLVSDPNSSLRQGDTIRFSRCKPVTQHVRHVVREILAPWGPAIGERPPVFSEEERSKLYQERQERKLEKRKIRLEEGEKGEKGEKRERNALAPS